MTTLEQKNISMSLRDFVEDINKEKKDEVDKYLLKNEVAQIRIASISKPGREDVSKEFEEKRKNFVKLVESITL